MKKTILLLAVITALFSSSCNENTDLDPTTPIYQHYEVDFYKDKAVAMANFHKHTAQGSLVELNNGASIKVNNTPMSFYGTGNSEGVFDYATYSIKSDNITFTFKRGDGNTYTNTVHRSDVSAVSIPEELNEIQNDKWISVNYKPTGFEVLTAVLFPKVVGKSYVATTDYVTGNFCFKDVPEGLYSLRVTIKRQIPTKENDKGASGLIDIYSVDEKNMRVVK